MNAARTIRSTLVAVGCAAILTGPAVAGGEPKNASPFTRQVNIRAIQASATVKPESAIYGEAKNEPPFTLAAPVTIQSSSGFNWVDAGIGLVAGIGLAATGAGLVALRLNKPPQTA